MKITCPECGREGTTPAEPPLGSKLRCPGCKKQFAYAFHEEFVVVEPPPGYIKPHEWPKLEPVKSLKNEAWLAAGLTLGVMVVVVLGLVLAASGTSTAMNLAAVLLLPLVILSPVVLVVCLLIMLVKYVAKSTMREMDAERGKR